MLLSNVGVYMRVLDGISLFDFLHWDLFGDMCYRTSSGCGQFHLARDWQLLKIGF